MIPKYRIRKLEKAVREEDSSDRMPFEVALSIIDADTAWESLTGRQKRQLLKFYEVLQAIVGEDDSD